MSIPVQLEDLARVVEGYGSALLVTIGQPLRIKVHTVDPLVRDGALVIAMRGRGSAVNLAANPQATVVWMPLERHGYTLIVDGNGVPTEDGVMVFPESAMLHRPAGHADGPASTYP
ncbi:MAG: pyridoxamine 5'-phosphate oxidase [Dermatophilaceae bacterium]